jgi:hypothetical protein
VLLVDVVHEGPPSGWTSDSLSVMPNSVLHRQCVGQVYVLPEHEGLYLSYRCKIENPLRGYVCVGRIP